MQNKEDYKIEIKVLIPKNLVAVFNKYCQQRQTYFPTDTFNGYLNPRHRSPRIFNQRSIRTAESNAYLLLRGPTLTAALTEAMFIVLSPFPLVISNILIVINQSLQNTVNNLFRIITIVTQSPSVSISTHASLRTLH